MGCGFRILTMVVVVAALMLVAPLTAQDGARARDPKRERTARVTDAQMAERDARMAKATEARAKTEKAMVESIKDLDVDGNGRVSEIEFIDYYRKRFRDADKNADGELDVREIRGARLTPQKNVDPAAAAAMMLERLDRDGDGVVKLEEIPEKMRPKYSTLDANGDGVLAKEEWLARGQDARQKQMDKSAVQKTRPVRADRPVKKQRPDKPVSK